MDGSARILLINPNTADAVTALLGAEARRVAGDRAEIVAVTAPFGAPGIQTLAEAAVASDAVVELLRAHEKCDVAVTGAFLDPGYDAAVGLGLMPVVGFGRAGITAAAAGHRRFAIVMAGAAMQDAVAARVDALGLGDRLAALRVIGPSVRDIIADRAAAADEIIAAARCCVTADGAEAVLLGGAPFAGLAAEIGRMVPVPVLDGVEAAIEAALAALPRR